MINFPIEIWKLPYPSSHGTETGLIHNGRRNFDLNICDQSKENDDWTLSFSDVSQYNVIFLPDIISDHIIA